ncbi:tetratricopeptide repeat protein [Bacteroides sedimenti]|uniref:tetratricopeptide repeat protein n=1 Tax=Bacteroides sedimenti TaxID=2136147 RepID=UPI003342778C
MKCNFLFSSILFLASLVLNLSPIQAKDSEGISFFKAGFPKQAKSLLFQELKSNTNSAETCYFLGNVYFGESKKDSALYYYNKGLSFDAMSALNNIGLAKLQIKSNPTQAKEAIDNVLKGKNKKNVDLILEAGRAYLENGELVAANDYLTRAQNITRKYAPVFVLAGDIFEAKKDAGQACSMYQQAIYFDANCREAYIKYARAYRDVNTALAVEMLERLKVQEPGFSLANKELADLYYSKNDFDKASASYGDYIASGNYDSDDLKQYAMTLFLNKNYAKSLEIAQIGLKLNSTDPAFNRFAMYNYIELKRFDEAAVAADLFFNKSKNAQFSYFDYTYNGALLAEQKKYPEAIASFKKAIEVDSTKTNLLTTISDLYEKSGDQLGAIQTYESYVNTLSKQTPDQLIELGKKYYNFGNSQVAATAASKTAALVKADSLFAKVAELEPDNYRGVCWRARANAALDPETTKGIAKPYYEKTVEICLSKADERYNPVLVECYSYLGYWYLISGEKNKSNADYDKSKEYWNKILKIDPSNPTATKALEGLSGGKSKKR